MSAFVNFGDIWLPVVIGFLFADAEVSEDGVEYFLSGDGVTRYFAECLEHATEVQRDKVGWDVGIQSLQHSPKMGGCFL